jgi:uncharacterized protein affecting Mg2+/Co2+ transport
MKTLLLLPLLLATIPPAQDAGVAAGDSSVGILGSKWSRISRKPTGKEDPAAPMPAAAITRADLNFERNRRATDAPGIRYPEADSVDARAAAIEKNVRAAQSPDRKTLEVFEYRAKVRNAGARPVEVIFWEYQLTEKASTANVVRRQFLCGVRISPGAEKELQAFSPAGPDAVIDVGSLAGKPGNLFAEKVTINRVEYADGSIWQRRDWDFAQVRAAVARAVATPWGAEMCRAL